MALGSQTRTSFSLGHCILGRYNRCVLPLPAHGKNLLLCIIQTTVPAGMVSMPILVYYTNMGCFNKQLHT
ncbi:hypothetical protein BDV39DRAFT_165537 [Aspergillus sergii]|uniref:Uncharacterized protein n=1 Tax=Aspergillus sergii TaxID=1034303 RepID=A0A5N6XPF8_9EURO|nr:hypothetical protein BDV39DRAFT_165537 [Aspergillus sergii]